MLIGKCIFLTTALQTVLSHTCIPFELLVLAFRKQLRVVMGDEFGSGTCRAPAARAGSASPHAPVATPPLQGLLSRDACVRISACAVHVVNTQRSMGQLLPIHIYQSDEGRIRVT